METINQTNRTILFEEINPEKLNLLTLIGEVGEFESLNDEQIQKIHSHLLVHSFDEFLIKFNPTIYSFFNAYNQSVTYTLKKPEGIPSQLITETPLSKDNDFLNMLLILLETKKCQKKTQVDFKFENILDLISPQVQMDAIRKLRQMLRGSYGKYIDALEDTPEKKRYKEAFQKLLTETSHYYSNVMAILPLAIEDLKERLVGEEEVHSTLHNEIVAGIINQKFTYELEVLEAPEEDVFAHLTLEESVNNALIEEVRKSYKASAIGDNAYLESLVVRTFCPTNGIKLIDEEIEEEVNRYNYYLAFYKKAKDEFIRTAKPLIEKILGIKVFFDQYQIKEGKMAPTLVITNVSNSLLASHKNINRLKVYLNTVNTKNDFNDCIWFGIIPSVEFETGEGIKLTRQRFMGNEEKSSYFINTLETTTTLLNTLKDYKVQTFISFEEKDKTTFVQMKNDGIYKYKEYCEIFQRKPYSEYTIVCMPNFTIIPKEKSGIFINQRILLTDENQALLSKESKDKVMIWIDGLYVGACYVAAGIVAAYQCASYLKEIFKKEAISEACPGVRIDIEALEYPIKTTLAKEVTGFQGNVIDEIMDSGFGFIFASENNFKKEKKLPHATIWQARSMKLEGRTYEPIYKTLTCNYVERVLRYTSMDFKQDNILYFFSNHPNSQKSTWLTQTHYMNAVIGKMDELSFSLDEVSNSCVVAINFNGAGKQFEVKVNRKEKVKKR